MEKRSPFHEQLRYERLQKGWSQADLAEKLGCGTKTVGRWESGEQTPQPHYRQKLCTLLDKTAEALGLMDDPVPMDQALEAQEDVDEEPLLREDWNEAPHVVSLYGREEEYARLVRWIGTERCQVVTILGMGGMGKSVLASEVARRIKQDFSCVFWRTLQNAPPFDLLIKQFLHFLSHQQFADLPTERDEQLLLLLQCIREQRCLLVLDNFESLLQAGQRAGQYRKDYEAYGKLVKLFGETRHQSCLLLTSREKPREVTPLEGKAAQVHSLSLPGLDWQAAQKLLCDRELVGSDQAWSDLVGRYSGNPLALQLVAEPIQEVFSSDIARFLREEMSTLRDIGELLDQHFQRLPGEEQEVLYWLAIEREGVPLEVLGDDLAQPLLRRQLPDALESLRRRSMIELRGASCFVLQPVIMEYITDRLIERASLDFGHEDMGVWWSHVLSKAGSKDYVRASQARLILAPVAQHLLLTLGKRRIVSTLEKVFAAERERDTIRAGYLASNVLSLLICLGIDLRGFDFSHLMVRQAYLQNLSLPEVNFAHVHFQSSVFTRTFGCVLSIATNPDGRFFAVGTSAGEISLYQAQGGTCLLSYREHTDGVWSVAFSPDSCLLASSSDDQTICLWDIKASRCIQVLRDHTNRVRSVAFSPDGRLLASGSDDQTIRLWDVSTGGCRAVFSGHSGRVWSVAFDATGEFLASGSTDQTIRVWDVASGQCLDVFEGHSHSIRSIAFSPDGSRLLSGSDDRTIRVWDVSSSQCLNILREHSNRVWSVAYSSDGQTIASGSEDHSVRLWNVHTGKCLKVVNDHKQGVRCVTFQADGRTLISGGDDQTCRLWDTITGDCLTVFQGYGNRIWSVAFGLDGSRLVSIGDDEKIRLWDSDNGTCLQAFQPCMPGILAVAFGPDGRSLASGGQDQVVHLWNIASGRCVQELRGHTNWIRSVAFSPDGRLLASGGEDCTVCLWERSTGDCLHVLREHTSLVRSVAFSRDGNWLASGSDDQSIGLWEVSSGACLKMLQGHTGSVRSVAFSSQGGLLASGSEDQSIGLWEASSGLCLKQLHGHSSRVRSVAFSPDGRLLASGSEDETIRLWDVSGRSCLRTLRGHTDRVRWVTFSPDGKQIGSCSDDRTIKLWDVQTGQPLATLIGQGPYQGMNIFGAEGLTSAEKESLFVLGAIERFEA